MPRKARAKHSAAFKAKAGPGGDSVRNPVERRRDGLAIPKKVPVGEQPVPAVEMSAARKIEWPEDAAQKLEHSAEDAEAEIAGLVEEKIDAIEERVFVFPQRG